MRILHTSDWHLGRAFHGFSLAEHQRAVLGALVDVVVAEAVELVVVSGDLYDRAVPPLDAVESLSSTLAALRDAGAAVVAISGNHDSAVRLGFAADVLAAGGIHTRTDPARATEPLVFRDRTGVELVVYALPYLQPDVAGPGASADRALRAVLRRAREDLAARPDARSLVLAHAFVTGGQTSESERPLCVGGSPEVGLGAFRGFDYVALGHLHGRQTFGDGRVRYSGSPLAYSFSEHAQTKGAWLVDMGPAGRAEVTGVDLPVPRPLAVVRGSIDELLSAPAFATGETAWVHATITDGLPGPDAVTRLRRRFPYLCALATAGGVGDEGPRAGYRARTHGRTDAELVSDFWNHATGRPAEPEVAALLDAALSAASVAEPAVAAGDEAA
jgi:DNA repair protein SbcD/Mre11